VGSGKPYTERIGEKHNMLTIIKITGKEYSGHRTKIRCLVKCDCGKEKDVRIEGVVNGQQYSCGCTRKKNENSAQRKMFNNYKNGAISRGYSFDLTEEQFVSISTSNCHYCGIEPSNVQIIYGDTFVLNGIDRKDNNIGYAVDNCLPCCSICNRAKSDMPYDDFVAWIRRFKHV
jgi:hypothetical protein